MTPMKPTPISSLALVAVVLAVAGFLLYGRFYGDLGARSWWDLLFPWVLTLVCAAAARWIRSALDDGRVGQDSSQVQPLTMARWLVIGTASEWLGAVLAGLYAGALVWALPRWSELAAAAEDGPVLAVGALSGVALAAAGAWLEKSCRLPPDDEPPAASGGEPVPPSVGWGT